MEDLSAIRYGLKSISMTTCNQIILQKNKLLLIFLTSRILTREQGSILFCTTGILLQFMKSDPALRSFSHIILDEIHERTTESDFIITLLKQVMPKVSFDIFMLLLHNVKVLGL